jgi:hypothetical protein
MAGELTNAATDACVRLPHDQPGEPPHLDGCLRCRLLRCINAELRAARGGEAPVACLLTLPDGTGSAKWPMPDDAAMRDYRMVGYEVTLLFAGAQPAPQAAGPDVGQGERERIVHALNRIVEHHTRAGFVRDALYGFSGRVARGDFAGKWEPRCDYSCHRCADPHSPCSICGGGCHHSLEERHDAAARLK